MSIFIVVPLSYLNAETVTSSDISVDTIPSNPKPYDTVTIRLTTYSTDLNKAMIEWRSGTVLLLSGYGKTDYSFKTSGPNNLISISATIVTETGEKIIKNISIKPSEIDVIWQSVDGYVPPFYKGKSFPSSGSNIKVVAIPNTSNISKSTSKGFSYTWTRNDKVIENNSGYGKNSYVFNNDEFEKTENITVSTSSIGNSYSAKQNLKISMINPNILFYKKSPSDGIMFNSAVTDNDFIQEDEVTLVAEPYFSTIVGGTSNYEWKINGNKIETPQNPLELTIRPSSRGGYATIQLMIDDVTKFFQQTVGKIKLTL